MLPNFSDQFQGAYTVFKTDENSIADDMYKLYPNPTNGSVVFKHRLLPTEKAELNIYTIEGANVKNILLQGSDPQDILLDNLATGLYLYTISINGMPKIQERLAVIK